MDEYVHRSSKKKPEQRQEVEEGLLTMEPHARRRLLLAVVVCLAGTTPKWGTMLTAKPLLRRPSTRLGGFWGQSGPSHGGDAGGGVVVVGVLLPAAAAVSDRQCIVWARECREPAEQH